MNIFYVIITDITYFKINNNRIEVRSTNNEYG